MDRDEAREAAYSWIEKTFIDKIACENEEDKDEYNLADEMGFNKYQVDLDTCWLENVGFADELLNMLYDDIKLAKCQNTLSHFSITIEKTQKSFSQRYWQLYKFT